MLAFPIGTDRPQRIFPWTNVLLIVANIVAYLATHSFTRVPVGFGQMVDPFTQATGLLPFCKNLILDPQHPHLYQFITYQFLHEGLAHIGFNMLFLYVFGNNLNEKLGHLGYLAFYLTGGILAGCGQTMTTHVQTLGASGAISAVSGLFLVLLPRTHIRLFVSIFFLYIDVWEIPSLFFVLFKAGEDVFEQFLQISNVAYMAHITGTVAGIAIGFLLLLSRLVQRDHYDLLAMVSRYRRRKAYEAVVSSGYDPFRGLGAVALGGGGGKGRGRQASTVPAVDPRIASLRSEITRLIKLHELPDATKRYLELITIDPSQVMGAEEQLDIANQLMAEGEYAEAAGAYEDYLRVYPGIAHVEQVMLILGLIYARYYPKPERARELFSGALPRLHDLQQRAMAEGELQKLGGA